MKLIMVILHWRQATSLW